MAIREELAFLTVAEMGEKLRARLATSVDLTETYLARMEKLAPKLHCVVTLTADLALSQAAKADAEMAAGTRRGPLHGIPYGLKDLVDTKGIRTTFGARPYSDRIPDADATVYTRLTAAGGVLLGKLSMIELAGGLGYSGCDASLNGACRTPWDENRWAGGSSSGSAAAVAAGLAAFAIGSETWGSITCPAAFCGVTGLRPTYGAVSRHGAMPLSFTLDKLGPICRSAGDAALVLGAIAGIDPLDPTSIEPPPGLATVAPVATGVRAGLLDLGLLPPDVQAAFDAAVAVLQSAGVVVTKVALPDLPVETVAMTVLTGEVGAAFDSLIRAGRVKELSDKMHQKPKSKDAPVATASEYVKAMQIRRMVQQRLAELFTSVDVILAPSMNVAAPLIDRSLDEVFDGYADPLGAAGNLAGLPAVSVPCGFVAPGQLPVGMQIVGKPLSDAKVLSLAAAYQGKTDWHRRRPPIS